MPDSSSAPAPAPAPSSSWFTSTRYGARRKSETSELGVRLSVSLSDGASLPTSNAGMGFLRERKGRMDVGYC